MKRVLVLAVLLTSALLASPRSAYAHKPCYGIEDKQGVEIEYDGTTPVILSKTQCESIKRKELRLNLGSIENDEGNDIVNFSIGAKSLSGAMLYIRIPLPF